jgi:hypothetical protein
VTTGPSGQQVVQTINYQTSNSLLHHLLTTWPRAEGAQTGKANGN